jgi:hypothetical protein
MELKKMKTKICVLSIVIGLLLNVYGVFGVAGYVSPPKPIDPGQDISVLSYTPKSYNFGNMVAGQTNSNTFEIWNDRTGMLSYSISESCNWVTVTPTSGSSIGEHDRIIVSIDTSGLSPGSYNCPVGIRSNGGSGKFTVYVTVIEPAKPVLSYSPKYYDFGDWPVGQIVYTNFYIWNGGGGTLNYSLSESSSWVTVSPDSGISNGEDNPIHVYINTTGLNPGSYSCPVSISSNGGSGIFTAYVTVNLSKPILSFSNSLWDFGNMTAGQTALTTFEIWNSGGGTLNYSLSEYYFSESSSWLTVTPTSGDSTGEKDNITVSIDTTGLSPGSYSCNIIIISNAGSSTFTVYVNVVAPDIPVLSYSPLSYDFGNIIAGQTASMNLLVGNSGSGELECILSESCSWVTLESYSVISNGEFNTITVYIDTTGLSPGSYSCPISISSNGGSGTFTVYVTVIEPKPALCYNPSDWYLGDMLAGQTSVISFWIRNSGTGTLIYNLSESSSWVVVTPTSGDSTGEKDTITVSIDTTGLSPGSYSCPIDIFCNAGSGTFTVYVTVISSNPDTTPPVTTCILSGKNVGSNTFTVSVTVSLSAVDDLSGVQRSMYSINNGPWTVYSTPFAITKLGTYTISYYSIDNAGNQESTKFITFTVVYKGIKPPNPPIV